MRALPTVLALLAFLVPPAVAAAEAPATDRGLQLHRQIQRDPLLVLGIGLDDPEGGLAGLAGILDRVAGDATAKLPGAALVDPATADLLRAELLPRLGSEVTLVVDPPPIDDTFAVLQRSKEEAISVLLGGTGVLARVQDRPGLERLLRDWILAAGGQLAESEGLTEAVLSFGVTGDAGSVPDPLRVRLFYAFDKDRWAIGFAPEWVRTALAVRPKGERFTDGEDFKRVFGALDARPSDLLYLNLPKLRALIAGSHLAQVILQSDAGVREFADRVLTAEAMGVGLGATSVRVGGGVRTTSFGPSWMSGTAVSSGYVAALALPSLFGAGERGKAQRTGTDIRAIAEACEGFSSDSRSYPGPTDGWVPVERIAAFLEPVYIARLPRTDGWHNPILYWSDGGTYRLVSTGRDGRMDLDWTRHAGEEHATSADGDIVFADGEPLAWPTWLTEE